MTLELDDAIEHIQSEEDDLSIGIPVYRIRSYPSDPELETLHSRWKRGDIVIPDFQRSFVWSPTQASRLIESFLMGLPVPGIFMLVEELGPSENQQKHLVIDGQQRLKSIFGFIEGQLPDGRPFNLIGVDPRWEGKSYQDLDPAERRALLTSVLRAVNIEERAAEPEESSRYQIFERLNTGGTILTPQEIRNCSYHGSFNNMLLETNREPAWRSIFGRNDADPRMRDIELIVRVLALHERAERYVKPMKKFLNDYMKEFQRESKPEVHQQTFLNAVRLAGALGTRPFHIRRGINVAVFDSVMVALASASDIPTDIRERYEQLKLNRRFVELTTTATTDADTVKERVRLAQKTLLR